MNVDYEDKVRILSSALHNSSLEHTGRARDDYFRFAFEQRCPLRQIPGPPHSSEIRVYHDGRDEFLCDYCRGKTTGDVMRRIGVPWHAAQHLELLPFDQWEKTITANRREIVEGRYRERDVVNVVAASKGGKTYMVGQEMLCIAAEIPFLGRQTWYPGKPLLVFDYELHRDTLKERINHQIEAMGLPQSVKQRIVYHTMRGAEFRRMDAICEWLQANPGQFSVVVFDALYRALPVGMSENDNREFTEIYNLLAITADVHGCAFILPSHSSKGDQSRRSSIDVGSGAGAQGRACDTHIVLRAHPRISGLAQMTVDVRSFQAVEPVALKFEWPLWIVANEDDYRGEPPPPPFTTDDLLALVPFEPMGRREFVKRTFADHKARIKKIDLEILLQDAIDKGLIVATAGQGRRAETIHRPPQEAAA